LAARYPQDVVQQAFGRFAAVTFAFTADRTGGDQPTGLEFAIEGKPLKLNVFADKLDLGEGGGSGSDDPRVAAARQDLEALRAQTQAPKAQVLAAAATLDDLVAALRPFTRRMFLSPRLSPILEARGHPGR